MTAIKFLFKNSRPLKYSIFSLVTYLLLEFLLTSCEQNPTAPNEPPKPYGYQEDIYWPSLADSPWPMYRADPQNTGRSKITNQILGYNDWAIDSLYNVTGISVGPDSCIYFVARGYQFQIEKSGIYCYSANGNFKWMYPFPVYTYSISPIITVDGTIYVSSRTDEHKLYAINKNGTLKWVLDNVRTTQTGINIGKDGTIYFLDDLSGVMTLTAVSKYGKIEWTLSNPYFSGDELDGMSISPDGKTIYVPGWFNEQAIFAIDIETRSIKWEFGKNRVYLNAAPLVDAAGNIYLITTEDNINGFLYSLTPNAQIRWKYPLRSFGGAAQHFNHFSMDKNGNIYIGIDTLYSISYTGKLNWKILFFPIGGVSSPIICDANNNIYFRSGEDDIITHHLFSINSDGEVNWSIEEQKYSSPFSYSLALSFSKIYVPSFHSGIIYSIHICPKR